ncbi:MAG: hypothetical protein MUE30_04515 [Spirosomaceae bacterium]|jgi:hypothetical protein|nr:hypothetical protein [Spirosomataceae bacterium]
MKKSYEQYKINDIEEAFGVSIASSLHCVITDSIKPYQLSDTFKEELLSKARLAFAIDTEKARSELIVTTILFELRKILREQISFFSGITFDVDASKGLKGRCDFLISLNPEQMFVRSPIISLVEAKNDNIKNGLGQCIAEMIAAQIFNERKGNPIPTIFGVVTTGANWSFLKLTGKKVCIEITEIQLESVELIFGVLMDIIQQNQKFVKH